MCVFEQKAVDGHTVYTDRMDYLLMWTKKRSKYSSRVIACRYCFLFLFFFFPVVQLGASGQTPASLQPANMRLVCCKYDMGTRWGGTAQRSAAPAQKQTNKTLRCDFARCANCSGAPHPPCTALRCTVHQVCSLAGCTHRWIPQTAL